MEQQQVAGQQEMWLARPPGCVARDVGSVHVFDNCRFFDRVNLIFQR
jgi:hypothetical protein